MFVDKFELNLDEFALCKIVIISVNSISHKQQMKIIQIRRNLDRFIISTFDNSLIDRINTYVLNKYILI